MPNNFLLLTHLKFLLFILLLIGLNGCSGSSTLSESNSKIITPQAPAPAKAIVYILMHEFFLDMRPNILFLDGKEMGQIKDDNYFVFEVWPGKYNVRIDIPSDNFLFHRNGYNFIDKYIEVNEPDRVFVYEIDSTGSTKLYPWLKQPDDIAARVLAKSLSAEQTAQVKRLYGHKWNGPAKRGYADGVGTLTYYDGRVYKGPVERNQLKAEGILEYPNGNIYKGSYDNEDPDGMGMLLDSSDNIIFSGNFRDGKPHGAGTAVINGQPVFTQYNYGRKLETDPVKLAQKAVTKEDNQTLSTVGQSAKIISEDITDLKQQQIKNENRFIKDESEMSGKCHCVFHRCISLTALSSTPATEAEKKAKRVAHREFEEACHEWRASGGTKAQREANFKKKMAASKSKLNKLLAQEKEAKIRDKEEKQKKIKELERTRKMRIAEQKRALEASYAQKLEAHRQSCKGKESYCGCAAFRPKSMPEPKTCAQ